MANPEETTTTIATQYGNLEATVYPNGEISLTGTVTINRIDYRISKTVKKEGDKFQTTYWNDAPSMTESARKKYYPEEEAALQSIFSDADLFKRAKLFYLREELAKAKKKQGDLRVLLSRWATREALIEASLSQENPAMCETIDGYYSSRGEFIPHGNGRTKCSLPKHNEQVPHSFLCEYGEK